MFLQFTVEMHEPQTFVPVGIRVVTVNISQLRCSEHADRNVQVIGQSSNSNCVIEQTGEQGIRLKQVNVLSAP